MSSFLTRQPTGALAATALTVLAAGAAVPAAATAAPRVAGSARVVSVDGPGRLTIENRKREKIAIRLFGIDTPQAGECGADGATAALRAITAGKLRGLHYSLNRSSGKQLERDADGRYVGTVSYERGRGYDAYAYGIGARLVDFGWARAGIPATLDSPTPANLERVADAYEIGSAPKVDQAGRPLGVWSACGGRLHQSGGAPAPATAAVPWSTDTFGVTRSIGPLTLTPTLTPESSLTMRRLAEQVGPIELVRYETTCAAYVPALQIEVIAWTTDRPGAACGNADVQVIYHHGPGTPSLAGGLKRGDSFDAVRRAYPAVDDESVNPDTGTADLSGGETHAWAWQTAAVLDEDERTVTSFVTYAMAGGFD